MIKSILKSIKHEYKLMIKEKVIFIVIIIIPLLTNLLLGYQFNKGYIANIPMAIYDQDDSSLSRMIVQQFRENDSFDVKYYPMSSEGMKTLIEENKVRVGMIIPIGFSEDVTELRSPKILMIYDGSHMPMAGAAKTKASEILLTLKTGIAIKLLKAKLGIHQDMAEKMALAIQFSNRTLYNPTGSYKYFLNTGFGTAIVQSAIALLAASAIRRYEMRKRKMQQIGNILGKIVFYSLLGVFSLVLNIYIQNSIFNIPMRGNIYDAIVLSILLAVAVSSFSTMISTWIKDKSLATTINAIIFVPNTVMIGYTWPILSMPKGYQLVSNLYPFYHYADNLRNIFLKGITLRQIQGDIMWYIYFISITIAINLLGVLTYREDISKVNAPSMKEGEEVEAY